MSKINTLLILMFTIFYLFFGIKITSIKKEEHNKLLNLQIIKEISDLDFKVQLILEEIKQIEQTEEFSEYTKDTNSHLKVYKFHQKMKQLFNIFTNLPLDNYMNLGFFNHTNNYLIYSSYNSINKAFFKDREIDIEKILREETSQFISGDSLFIFKRVENLDILWFLTIDLKKNFPVLYNEDLANFKLLDRKNDLISQSGELKEKPITFSSLTLGTFKYEITNKINKDDIYIAVLLLFVYFQICLILFLFQKFINRNILTKIINSLEYKNSEKIDLNDITVEIDKIIHEKKEVEYMYRTYSKSYQNLLLKEYLMGLNTDLTDINNLFKEFNSPIRCILISQDTPMKKKEKLYEKMKSLEECIFLNTLSGIEIILIKEKAYKDIEGLIEISEFLIFVSDRYKDLSSIKGEWKEINNSFNKFNIMHNKADLDEIMSGAEKDKQKKMIKYIENNYQKDISLLDLSEVIGETPKYTSFLFKKYTKVNFKEALTTYRINEAKRIIIENPDVKLKDVCKQVGYNSLISFTNSFKRQEKIPPSLWKENAKKNRD